MIDSNVRRLLEQVINSRTKLHLLLVFYESPLMETTPGRLAQRCCRDIWSVNQSLQEMAENGILMQSQVLGGEPIYNYVPEAKYIEPINSLMSSYDDPLKRDAIYRSLREISEYASISQQSNGSMGFAWAI